MHFLLTWSFFRGHVNFPWCIFIMSQAYRKPPGRSRHVSILGTLTACKRQKKTTRHPTPRTKTSGNKKNSYKPPVVPLMTCRSFFLGIYHNGNDLLIVNPVNYTYMHILSHSAIQKNQFFDVLISLLNSPKSTKHNKTFMIDESDSIGHVCGTRLWF